MRAAVKLLLTLYQGSVGDCANIVTAEAENDAETIKAYLKETREFVTKLLTELEDDTPF